MTVVLETGAEMRLTGEGATAVVCVNGGQAAEVEGTWSASLEWLVRRLAPRLPQFVFAEVRYRVNDQFGLVGFVDAGNAFSSMIPSFDSLRVGAGVGLRYLTPIGPIRLDAAIPLTRRPGDPTFALYVGLRQAF